MKRSILILIFLVGILFAFCLKIDAGEKLWVSSNNAKLKSDKTASSQTVEKLAPGAELNLISRDKKWYQVSTSTGKCGWIYRGNVSDAPPGADDQQEDEQLFDEIVLSSIDTDTASTSRSIRGRKKKGSTVSDEKEAEELLPRVQKYAHEAKIPKEYQDALINVLTLKPEGNEIELFLKNGKIGEYAP
ncbi:MAG: SH3 domain-containing protein [bacterium]